MKNNELVVKNVSFCGAELLAVQEKETGRIYAGINSVLREIGFDEGQIRYRRDKWSEDKVLFKGVRKFLHPSIGGGKQETYCIDIKKLPLALAKLEITPKMEKEMPELTEKLEVYQDRCADVLADAFLPKAQAGGTGKNRASSEERYRIMDMNARSRMAQTYLRIGEIATLSPTYKNVIASKACEILAGEQIIPLPKVEQRKTYTAKDIGEMFGISANMVGRIKNQNDLKTEEYGEYRRDKSRHSAHECDTWVYFETVIPEFERILGRGEEE